MDGSLGDLFPLNSLIHEGNFTAKELLHKIFYQLAVHL